jgi:hypothetical protein
MQVLERAKSSRHPDSFMYVPMFIVSLDSVSVFHSLKTVISKLGMATNLPDRPALLLRLEGVTECSRPKTMGNDIMSILVDVWTHSTGRAIKWSDLRPACLRVVRM